MRWHSEDGLLFLSFSLFSDCPGISHAVFTRSGGGSSPPFDELNLGSGVGDRADLVEKNREKIRRKMGSLVFTNQVHGDFVRVVTEENPSDLPAADALVTNIPGKNLVIQTADCQAVMIHDPVRQVVANIHSGWKSSIRNIIGAAAREMEKKFGSRMQDCMAGIGPSLGPCCAEFINYPKEIPPLFLPYKIGKNHFDFWRISKDQLITAGIPEKNIETAEICTKCNAHLFYSYRKENITGRFASVIGLC